MPWTDLASAGMLPDSLAVMAPLSVLASNTIGNVPAVVLLLAVWHQPPEGALYGLALLSTLAETADPRQSRQYHRGRAGTGHGRALGFMEHARCGIPMTLMSLAFACLWLWVSGLMPLR